MIELMPDLPHSVVGLVASGQVTAHDYEAVLIPAIESRVTAHKSMSAWQKLAVVTDVEWIAGATRLFGFGMPCPVKVYANSEIAEAKRWISAD